MGWLLLEGKATNPFLYLDLNGLPENTNPAFLNESPSKTPVW